MKVGMQRKNTIIKIKKDAKMKNPSKRHPYILHHDDIIFRIFYKMRLLGQRLIIYDETKKETYMEFEEKEKTITKEKFS